MITQAAPEQPTPRTDTVVVYGYVVFVHKGADIYALDYGVRSSDDEMARASLQCGKPLPENLTKMILARVDVALEWAQVTNTLWSTGGSTAMHETRQYVSQKAGENNATLNELSALAVAFATAD